MKALSSAPAPPPSHCAPPAWWQSPRTQSRCERAAQQSKNGSDEHPGRRGSGGESRLRLQVRVAVHAVRAATTLTRVASQTHRWLPSNLRGRRQDLIWPKGVNRPMMSLRVACMIASADGFSVEGWVSARWCGWQSTEHTHAQQAAGPGWHVGMTCSCRHQRPSQQAKQAPPPQIQQPRTSKATLRTTILLVSGSPALRLPPAATADAAAEGCSIAGGAR